MSQNLLENVQKNDTSKQLSIERGQELRSKTYVSIELPNKTREVAMLEESREQIPGKLRRLPDDEGGAAFVPRDDDVGVGIIHKHVGLQQEGWWI